MDEASFSRVLDSVYDAATSTDGWRLALDQIGQAFGCSYVGMIDRNLRTMEGRATAIGIDEAGQREYFEVWSKHDLLRLWTRTYRPGAVETDQDILPRSILLGSDYYNGFLKPRDMHAVMRVTLATEHGIRKFISMTRPVAGGDFVTADIEQGRRLMPHLHRAARISQSVESANLALTAFSEVLEQSARGVLLLEGSRRIIFANRTARAMAQAADSFVLRHDRIEALSGGDNTLLQSLIAGASSPPGRVEAARGGVMRLAAKSGRPGLSLAIAPLACGTAWSRPAPVAFILITDPNTQPPDLDAVLRQLFGLTGAETRVAERLLMGDSPERAAESLQVRITTVRWHLASLYRKTGASRQAELVRLLQALPTV
ncbi:MAG: helix-turn-helix transcriptional regulator [Reyranellaceae bacterium]